MDGNGIDGIHDPAAPADAAAPLVVVTGAGGFIGRHLAAFLRGAGFRVRAVTRSADPCASQPDGALQADAEPAMPHPGVGADADWLAVVAGADAVVHLAGLAHLPLDNRKMRAELRRVNVLSTQRLAQAAARSGVRTFVFMSSIKAVSDHSGQHPLTEAMAPHPQDCYGLAKLAAERRLRRVGSAAPSMRILILRPPLVYGPGVGANFAALAKLVRRGVPLPLNSVCNRRSLIYVGNLAAAVARCLQRQDVPGGIFHLSDGSAVSTPDLVRAIARAQQRPARLVSVPLNWLALAAQVAGKSAQFSRLEDSLEVSSRHFCRSFDWRPPFTMEEGLRATLQEES